LPPTYLKRCLSVELCFNISLVILWQNNITVNNLLGNKFGAVRYLSDLVAEPVI
jgi:hypothetical protein